MSAPSEALESRLLPAQAGTSAIGCRCSGARRRPATTGRRRPRHHQDRHREAAHRSRTKFARAASVRPLTSCRQGNASSSGNHASSSRDSSSPADPARRKAPSATALQPGFGRSVSARVERLEPLSPPGQPDRAERAAAVVDATTSAKARSTPHSAEKAGRKAARQLPEHDLAVVVELPFSDSRRPLLPRRPPTP